MVSKKAVRIFVVGVLLSGVIFAPLPVLAQETSGKNNNFLANVFYKFMQRFGFKQMMRSGSGTPMPTPSGGMKRTQKDMLAMDEERLTKLVEEGKITEAQKTAILAELKTIREKYSFESMKDLTDEERKKKMQEMQETLMAWAKEQSIDESYVVCTPPAGEKNKPSGTPPTGSPPAGKRGNRNGECMGLGPR